MSEIATCASLNLPTPIYPKFTLMRVMSKVNVGKGVLVGVVSSSAEVSLKSRDSMISLGALS